MSSVEKYVCPVCGFLLDYPPDDFNICPSCGVEFCADTAEYSIQYLQNAWIDRGMVWSSRVLPKPANYDSLAQLARLRFPPQSVTSEGTIREAKHVQHTDLKEVYDNGSSVGYLRLLPGA